MKQSVLLRRLGSVFGIVCLGGPTSSRWIIVFLVFAWLLPGVATGKAAPRIDQLDLHGLQIGGTTRLVVRGEHLDRQARVLLPIETPAQVHWLEHRQETVTDQGRSRVVDTLIGFVSIDRTNAPGLFPLRLATEHGVSNAFLIGLDRLPQIEFREQLSDFPVACHGEIAGDRVYKTHFVGQAGQVFVMDIEAQRLGSQLRPVVRLLGPDGRQLVIARPQESLHGDARWHGQLPVAGTYEIQLHDAVYQGPAPGWFRLKLGALQYVDRVYPPAVAFGSSVELEGLGANQVGRLLWRASSEPFQLGPQRATWPSDALATFTGTQPRVIESPWIGAELTEEQWAAHPQPLQPPLGMSGRLLQPREIDTFALRVVPGQRIHVALQAAQDGSPLDGQLDVVNADGAVLLHLDDSENSPDPQGEWEVPAGVTDVSVRVSSLTGEAGPEVTYRLVVEPVQHLELEVNLPVDGLNVPAGGQTIVPSTIRHRGPWQRAELALPAAVNSMLTLTSSALTAEDDLVLLEFRASEQTRGVMTTPIVARRLTSGEAPTIDLATAAFPGSQYAREWRRNLVVAITPESSLRFDWDSSTRPTYWARGGRQPLVVNITRPPEAKGNVRWTLLTSQRPPQKTENNQTVEDTARTWRLGETKMTPATESQARLELITPTDFPLRAASLALRGELLSEDGQQIVASADTPILVRPTLEPLALTVSTPGPLQVKAGATPGMVVLGRVERHRDWRYPVELHWEGLAEGDRIAPLIVGVDQTEWQWTLTFPPETPAHEVAAARVVARFVELPNSVAPVIVSSPPLPLKVLAP